MDEGRTRANHSRLTDISVIGRQGIANGESLPVLKVSGPRAQLHQEPQSASIDSMKTEAKAQLIVRNLEEDVVRELRMRAARHGRSAEAEHREILRKALLPAKGRMSLQEFLLTMPNVGEDTDFERSEDRGRDVEF